jgi:hypothetical protein
LREAGHLHVGVGAEEAPQTGIVDATVHIHQLKQVDVLVTGKTPGSGGMGWVMPTQLFSMNSRN